MPHSDLEPKLLTVLREGYSRHQLVRDILAGIVVGVVALPLAIAFAIASGVRPEQGLITAVLAGFLVSALGGMRVQIAGPTGAFVVIIYGVVQRYGYDGLAVATFMAGVLLVVMGLARLGAIIRFIPYPVTVGLTSGSPSSSRRAGFATPWGWAAVRSLRNFSPRWPRWRASRARSTPGRWPWPSPRSY